jgi:hypothetical protein
VSRRTRGVAAIRKGGRRAAGICQRRWPRL